MSNYIEYNDKIAFHPGYYIKEIIDESGLTQEDFAKRLATTPKNLSCLIRGKQSLSNDIAMKLSRMLGTSISYWLNLQNTYDSLIAEFESDRELIRERDVFKNLDYGYFRDNFHLPKLSRRIDEQILEVRKLLNIATLSVLTNADLAVNFRSSSDTMIESNIIKANAMVQLAINKALTIEAPKFNKDNFKTAVEYALTLTDNHENFYPLIRDAFLKAGVIFIILPNLPGSKINGATKKIGNNLLLMVNDRGQYSDTFWFTLFHEIGHIMNDDYGVSFEEESKNKEDSANKYAENSLIPLEAYQNFIAVHQFDLESIKSFSASIKRDPGIVLGRLQNDGFVKYNDVSLNILKHKYKIFT